MNSRIVAIALIAVIGMTIVAPAVSEDSSAATEMEGRISPFYISSAETVVPEQMQTVVNTMYMLHGSENQLAMEAYLRDPQNSVSVKGDDRDIIAESEPGTKMDVYACSYNSYRESIWVSGNVELTPRLAPYDIDVDAEAGDIVKIRIVEAGGNSTGYINIIRFVKDGPDPSSSNISIGGTYITEMMEGESLSMTVAWMDSEDFYADVRYDISVSAPNGSATLFAAVCIAIAALVLILMIVAMLKPKWAK